MLSQKCVFGQKCKSTTATKIKHKNPCRSRILNPGTFVPKVDALPLHQRDKLSYLAVSMQWVKM